MAAKGELETPQATMPSPPIPPSPTDSSDATVPREDMIETAIKFLQNPKVRQSPFAQRKLFLKKKGLTLEEIDVAIQRSGTASDETNPPPAPQPAVPQPALPTMAAQPGAMVPAMPPPVLPPRQSPWSKWRDFIATAVIVSGATYGLIKFFKAYIGPLLKSRQEEKEKVERIEASLHELKGSFSETMDELKTTLVDLKKVLAEQTEKIQELSTTSQFSSLPSKSSEAQGVNEIKAEIVSLKGLILNRHQFPAAPSPSPIPAWQRMNTAENTHTTNTVTVASTVQTEMTPPPPTEKNKADLKPEEKHNKPEILENGDMEGEDNGHPEAEFEGQSPPGIDVKGQDQGGGDVNGHDEDESQLKDVSAAARKNQQPNDLHASEPGEVKGHGENDDSERHDSRIDEEVD